MYNVTSKTGKQMQVRHLDLSVLMCRLDDDLSGVCSDEDAREVAEVLTQALAAKGTAAAAPPKRKGHLISHKVFKRDPTDISVDRQIMEEFAQLVEEGGFEVKRMF